MDAAEATAEQYLKHIGFKTVVYEPDGNIPPDFLCDQRVAVEVRRLNQLETTTTGDPRGLEETAIPLLARLRRTLLDSGPPKNHSHSWFVFFRFARPIPEWKKIGPKISAYLSSFRDGATADRKMRFDKNFEVEVAAASKLINSQCFVLGGYSDRNSGGWLLAEMQSSLAICIPEKTLKISKVRHRYPEWWLVLVDHVGYGLDEFDRELFRDQVKAEHTWDKVVLIDPRDGTRAFEI